MKSSIYCLLTIAVALSMSFGIAYADECTHEWHETTGNIEIKYEAISDSEHKIVTWVWVECTKCGVHEMQPSAVVGSVIEYHHLICVKDLGHGVDNDHFYLYQCTGCGHCVVITEMCGGPPCTSAIYGIKVPNEESDE